MPPLRKLSNSANSCSEGGVVRSVDALFAISISQFTPNVPIAADGQVARDQIWYKYSQTDVLPLVPVTAVKMAGRVG